MNQNEQDVKEEWIGFLLDRPIPNPLAVTLTLKQGINISSGSDGRYVQLTRSDISRNIRHFLNRLNQQVYGKAFTRFGRRLSVFPVIEGDSSVRFHVHLTLELPDRFTEAEYRALISECWSKTTFGYRNVDTRPMYSFGWVEYQLKEKTKGEDIHSSIDVENCFIP